MAALPPATSSGRTQGMVLPAVKQLTSTVGTRATAAGRVTRRVPAEAKMMASTWRSRRSSTAASMTGRERIVLTTNSIEPWLQASSCAPAITCPAKGSTAISSVMTPIVEVCWVRRFWAARLGR